MKRSGLLMIFSVIVLSLILHLFPGAVRAAGSDLRDQDHWIPPHISAQLHYQNYKTWRERAKEVGLTMLMASPPFLVQAMTHHFILAHKWHGAALLPELNGRVTDFILDASMSSGWWDAFARTGLSNVDLLAGSGAVSRLVRRAFVYSAASAADVYQLAEVFHDQVPDDDGGRLKIDLHNPELDAIAEFFWEPVEDSRFDGKYVFTFAYPGSGRCAEQTKCSASDWSCLIINLACRWPDVLLQAHIHTRVAGDDVLAIYRLCYSEYCGRSYVLHSSLEEPSQNDGVCVLDQLFQLHRVNRKATFDVWFSRYDRLPLNHISLCQRVITTPVDHAGLTFLLTIIEHLGSEAAHYDAEPLPQLTGSEKKVNVSAAVAELHRSDNLVMALGSRTALFMDYAVPGQLRVSLFDHSDHSDHNGAMPGSKQLHNLDQKRRGQVSTGVERLAGNVAQMLIAETLLTTAVAPLLGA